MFGENLASRAILASNKTGVLVLACHMKNNLRKLFVLFCGALKDQG
jgi:hypothetical protein